MLYSGENYEYLFDVSEEITKNAFATLKHDNVALYRTKTVKAGNMLEVEIYPIWSTRAEAVRAKKRTSREAQKNLNDKNAKKKLIRKINANFTKADIWVTLTYKNGVPDEEQARKDIRNYLRRVREWRRKRGMTELKYVYVIEYGGKDGRRKRVHHHVVMSGMDRSAAEELWNGKGWANARKLQPDEYGLEALARYVTKEANGGKRWCASRNLAEPKETTADTKISKRRVEKMATDFEGAPALIFEKLFPAYDFTDCEVKRSNFVAGAYIYARMRRRQDEKPKKKRRKAKNAEE